MLKIWGRKNSANVKKVLWTLEELGLDYERIDAGGAFGIVDDPAYRAMNPNGLVPVLQDGDKTFWESNTIVRYLAAQYGEATLYIADPAARAQAEKWMDWVVGSLSGPFRDVFLGLVRTPAEQRDMHKIEAGITLMTKRLSIVQAALEKENYLSGADFGIGDVPLGCMLYAWFELPITRPDLPHLQAWYERLKSRPAYQKTVMIGLS